VVVAILGILALLVVPNVVNRIKEARETVVDANIKVINNAIKMYYADKGDYPDIDQVQGSNNLDKLLKKLQAEGYLEANEVENAKEAFKNVSINVKTEGSKVTSIEKETEKGTPEQETGSEKETEKGTTEQGSGSNS